MDIQIQNQTGENLDYAFAEGKQGDQDKNTLVILGHGVTGNKDRPILVNTANALNAAGFHTLRFSYSGNGDSEGDFRESTISKEVADLEAVLNAVSGKYGKIVYIGHSMGGAVGVIKAASDSRISALVSLAGMVDTKAFAETEFGELTPDKDDMWEEEECPLSSVFMKDLCQTIGNVCSQAEKVRVPWLLVHGTADDVVLPEDSRGIKELLGEAVDLVMIKDANHVFSEPIHTQLAARAVVDWLSKQAT